MSNYSFVNNGIGFKQVLELRKYTSQEPKDWLLTSGLKVRILCIKKDFSFNSHKLPASPKLIPVTQWSKYHDYPKLSRLRNLIFYAETNGFQKCIRRIGRSVLINEEEFFKWADTQL